MKNQDLGHLRKSYTKSELTVVDIENNPHVFL